MARTYDPFEDIRRLEEEIDDIFARFLGMPRTRMALPRQAKRGEIEPYAETINFIPAVDVIEKDNEVVVKADLPGIDKKDIKRKVEPEEVIISGESKKERKEKIENDRKTQEKSQQEEADRSAKSQQEILDYQNGVQKLAKNAGYANDFFSEKFIFYSFYTNQSQSDLKTQNACPPECGQAGGHAGLLGCSAVISGGIIEVIGDKLQLFLQHQLQICHGVHHVGGRIVHFQQLAQVDLVHGECGFHLLALGAEDVAQSTFLQRDAFHQIDHSLTQGNTGQGRTFQRGGTIGHCHRGLILSI